MGFGFSLSFWSLLRVLLVSRSSEGYTVRRGLCPSSGTPGFPPLLRPVRHLPLWAARAPRLHRLKTFGKWIPGSTRTPPAPTCLVRPEAHSVFTCLPSFPPTEQRCLREHLELVVLHPPHHHRLLFYAEPCAGCAVRVSLCYSPTPLPLVIFPGRDHQSFASFSRH